MNSSLGLREEGGEKKEKKTHQAIYAPGKCSLQTKETICSSILKKTNKKQKQLQLKYSPYSSKMRKLNYVQAFSFEMQSILG